MDKVCVQITLSFLDLQTKSQYQKGKSLIGILTFQKSIQIVSDDQDKFPRPSWL